MKRRFLFALMMPVALILAVVVIIYWPTVKPTADENFIFSLTDAPVRCAVGAYTVDNQKVVWHVASQKDRKFCETKGSAQLYLYNVVKKQIEPLDLKSAKMFQVDANKTSLHGFRVSDRLNTQSDLPMIYIPLGEGVYLLGHNQAVSISLPPTTNNVDREFKFLGWARA